MSATSRRRWLGITLAALASPRLAGAAEERFREGVHYVRLSQPAPTSAAGRIEVVEFFWYECPHCNAFEPTLEAWSKKLAPDVALRRVPVYFREEPFAAQQRLFYALDSLGLVPQLQRRVFAAVHDERRRLRTLDDMQGFVQANGVDAAAFAAAWNSPVVLGRMLEARQLAAAYKIDAVPALGIQGRWYTTGQLAAAGMPPTTAAAGNARMLDVADALIDRSRRRS